MYNFIGYVNCVFIQVQVQQVFLTIFIGIISLLFLILTTVSGLRMSAVLPSLINQNIFCSGSEEQWVLMNLSPFTFQGFC